MNFLSAAWFACFFFCVPRQQSKVTRSVTTELWPALWRTHLAHAKVYGRVHLGQVRIHLPRKDADGGPKNVVNLSVRAWGWPGVHWCTHQGGKGKEGEHGDGPNSLVAHANSRA